MNNKSFFPTGYSEPQNETGSAENFNRIQPHSKVRLRVLSDFNDPKHAQMGWLGWDKHSGKARPIRKPYNDQGKKECIEHSDESSRHFWNLCVWNYEKGAVQVFDITQKSLMRQIKELIENDEWGPINLYDITVSRQGDGRDTKYTVFPCPKAQLPDHQNIALSNADIDLGRLFTDGKVFGNPHHTSEADVSDDLPF